MSSIFSSFATVLVCSSEHPAAAASRCCHEKSAYLIYFGSQTVFLSLFACFMITIILIVQSVQEIEGSRVAWKLVEHADDT